jgi:hypothetical protein
MPAPCCTPSAPQGNGPLRGDVCHRAHGRSRVRRGPHWRCRKWWTAPVDVVSLAATTLFAGCP